MSNIDFRGFYIVANSDAPIDILHHNVANIMPTLMDYNLVGPFSRTDVIDKFVGLSPIKDGLKRELEDVLMDVPDELTLSH